MTATSYPLYWPEGWPRTPASRRQHSRFSGTPGLITQVVFAELRRLGARNVILSSNIKLRQDGYPYAVQGAISDVGAAVFFTYKNQPMCFACDRFLKVHENIRAMYLTVQALRGIERWGASDMMERAFKGFAALEYKADARAWWDVLGVTPDATAEQVGAAYRRERSRAHPDKPGGSDAAFLAVTEAMQQAAAEIKGVNNGVGL